MSKKYSRYNATNICDICKKNELKPKFALKEKNKAGDWTGRWMCRDCYNDMKRLTYQKVKKVQKTYYAICQICGKEIFTTQRIRYTLNGLGLFDSNGIWDRKSYICTYCHENLPGGYAFLIKQMRQWRNKKLDLESTTGLGYLGEKIFCDTRNAINCNIEEDNFCANYDAIDKEYGNCQIKLSVYNDIDNRWTTGKIDFKPNCNKVVIICMDKNLKHVDRVYIIPQIVIIERGITTAIGIYKNNNIGWYEDYRVDEKSYDNIYQNMDLENDSVLKS